MVHQHIRVLLCLLAILAGCPAGESDDDVSGDDDGAPFGNDAAFVSQVVPTSVTTSEGFDVEITMENTGSMTWTRADGYRLGSQNPQDNLTWGVGRADMEEDASVAPGGSHTFAFSVTTPTPDGLYDFQWRMLQEYVEWFGDQTPDLSIDVAACADHCTDGTHNCGETDVDCGGECDACAVVELSAGQHGIPAVAATDEVVMVVFPDAEDSHSLHFTCKDTDGWTTPQAVPALGTCSDFARLETDSIGRIHLIVHQGLGDGRAVKHALFEGGSGCSGSWSTPVQVDDGTRNSCWPAIAIDSNDDPHAFWTEDYLQMQYARAPGGVWEAPIVVIDTPDEQTCHGDIAVDGTTAHVVWQEGTSPRIPTWSYWTGSGFSSPEALSSDFHNWPQIVADADGDLHVLYTWRYAPNDVKYVHREGGAWSGETVVSSGATTWTWSDLQLDDDGTLHAAWNQTDDVEHIYYCIGDAATGAWETPRRVSTDETLHNLQTTLSVDPSGRTHLVWVQVTDLETEESGPVLYRVVTWDDIAP